MTKLRVAGADLHVGDTIEAWWRPGRDTITNLEPYTGPLSHYFPHGAQLATFAIYSVGMTIDNGEIFDVIRPSHD